MQTNNIQKTRNLFCLIGNKADINVVLPSLNFKGMITLGDTVTGNDIRHAFSTNKSILCCANPEKLLGFGIVPIFIPVVSSENIKTVSNPFLCIVIDKDDFVQQFQLIVKSLNCDIGDPVSNISSISGNCPYCDCIKNNYDEDNVNFVIYKSKNFFVMPTLGEFIKGYLLIIPIQHTTSMATIPASLYDEFLEVLSDVTSILRLTYNIRNMLVWENGTGFSGTSKASNSIVHPHIHVAPSSLTPKTIQIYSEFDFDKIKFEDLSKYGSNSYLLLKNSAKSDEWWINDNPELYIPRQYIRQLIANEYNLEAGAWNWRTNPYVTLMKATYYDIETALRENWENLPQRIKHNTKDFLSE